MGHRIRIGTSGWNYKHWRGRIFHGTGKKYGGKYRPSRLKGWARWLREVSQDHDVFAYFNNDAEGYAVRDAQELRRQTDAS